jgi:hypothetical protein
MISYFQICEIYSTLVSWAKFVTVAISCNTFFRFFEAILIKYDEEIF